MYGYIITLLFPLISLSIASEPTLIPPINEIMLNTISPGETSSSFGFRLTGIGDVDGDGFNDIAVGASGENSVFILTMNEDLTVKDHYRIGDGVNGLSFDSTDNFGGSVSLLGDVDGDGSYDLAIGASKLSRVYIFFINRDLNDPTQGLSNIIKSYVTINSTENIFGTTVYGLPDLDLNGTPDLMVRSVDGDNFSNLHILFLNSVGAVISSTIISTPSSDPIERFGASLSLIPDLNGDDIPEIIASEPFANSSKGAVYILFINRDGIVQDQLIIPSGGGVFEFVENFGNSVAWIPELESDENIKYLAVDGNDLTDLNNDRTVFMLALNYSVSSLDKLISQVIKLPNTEDLNYGRAIATLNTPDVSNSQSLGEATPRGEATIMIGSRTSTSPTQGKFDISAISTQSGLTEENPDGRNNNDSNTLAIALGISLPVAVICCLFISIVVITILFITAMRYRSHEEKDIENGLDDTDLNKLSSSSTKSTSQLLEWGKTSWEIDFNELEIEQPPIASGAFGVVNKANYMGTIVAVKTLIGDSDLNSEEYHHEVELLTYLHHPNIVLFMGATATPRSMVTEFVSRGSLNDVILTSQLTPKKIKKISLDIAKGMSYLHGHKPPIIHRDLKSQNILISKDFVAKITDFGISRTVKTDQSMTQRAGTSRWTAPEVLQGGRYTEKADVYSFALILWEMMDGTGKAPFYEEQWQSKVEDKVIAGERPEIGDINQQPCKIVDLMYRCWAEDPEERPTFKEIVKLL